jgi:hypothetical protein
MSNAAPGAARFGFQVCGFRATFKHDHADLSIAIRSGLVSVGPPRSGSKSASFRQ